MDAGPPPRPGPREERFVNSLLRKVVPLPRRTIPEPPASLAPFERFRLPRADGGALDATLYPAQGEPRGAVLLGHPWMEWGQAYFHRRGRVEALRSAGWHALTFDQFGIGASASAPGFGDRDVDAALAWLATRAAGLPLAVWGVSSGGYWMHPALARRRDIAAAVFEDVTPHLWEWAAMHRPAMRYVNAAGRPFFRAAERYLDLRNHAPHLGVRAALYVYGARDPAIPEENARDLAKRAGAECFVVREAGHLEAIKVANREVLDRALATVERGFALSRR